MNIDKFEHIAGDICLKIKKCEELIGQQPLEVADIWQLRIEKTGAYIECAELYYQLFKRLETRGQAESDCQEVMAQCNEYRWMFRELVSLFEVAMAHAERRQEAEIKCQEVEEIFKKASTSIGRSDKNKVKGLLSNAVNHDETYGKVHYLLGKLSYETYLDACVDTNKDVNAAADVVQKHLLLAVTLSSESFEFNCIVESYLLLMKLEISLRNLVAAKEHYQALDGLKRSAEYTESQADRLSKMEDGIFPEAKQAKEEALARKKEDEEARKEADKFRKKQAQKNAVIEKEKKELAKNVEVKATELGVVLTDTSRHYVLAQVYEQEFYKLSAGINGRRVLIEKILSEYSNAVTSDEHYHEAYYARGIFRQNNDPDKNGIEADFERLLGIEAYNVKASLALGQQAKIKGNISEAKKYYESIVTAKVLDSKENREFKRLAGVALAEIQDELKAGLQAAIKRMGVKPTKIKLDKFIEECEKLIQISPDFYDAHLFLSEHAIDYRLSGNITDVDSYYQKIVKHLNYLLTLNSKGSRVYREFWRLYSNIEWHEAVKNCCLMLDNNPSEAHLQEAISFFSKKDEDKEKNKDRLYILTSAIKNKNFKNIAESFQDNAFKYFGVLYESENNMRDLVDIWSSWLSDNNIHHKVKLMTLKYLHPLKLTFYNLMCNIAKANFSKIEERLLQSQKNLYIGFMQSFENIFKEAGNIHHKTCFQEMFVWIQAIFKMLAELYGNNNEEGQALVLYEKAVEVHDFQSFEFIDGGVLRDHVCVLSGCANIRYSMSAEDPKVKHYYERIVAVKELKNFEALFLDDSMTSFDKQQVNTLIAEAEKFLTVARCEEVIKVRPDCYEALFYLASTDLDALLTGPFERMKCSSLSVEDAYEIAENTPKIIRSFNRLLVIRPGDPLAYRGLGCLHWHLDISASKIEPYKTRLASTPWKEAVNYYSMALNGSSDANLLQEVVALFAIDCLNQEKNQDRLNLLTQVRVSPVFESLTEMVKKRALECLNALKNFESTTGASLSSDHAVLRYPSTSAHFKPAANNQALNVRKQDGHKFSMNAIVD